MGIIKITCPPEGIAEGNNEFSYCAPQKRGGKKVAHVLIEAKNLLEVKVPSTYNTRSF
jgi:hypothetical protein